MQQPSRAQIVITWQAGCRGFNYWPQCVPVALFKFKEPNDFLQLLGRSNRNWPVNKSFKGITAVPGQATEAEMEATRAQNRDLRSRERERLEAAQKGTAKCSK